MRPTFRLTNLTCAALALAALVVLPAAAAAQVNGAIYTTSSDATIVNQNIYATREAVYLSGGPQTKNDAGLSPDGHYYFQVTDPSGAVLLSTDPIECREVIVSGGRITGVASSSCAHRLGAFNAENGQMPVQLFPFLETPNPGGEYKAWLTPVASYSPNEAAPACSGKNSNVRFGFCDADSKTDNFKIRSLAAAYVTVCKFHDKNGNGVQDAAEPLIPHWPITATGVDGGTVNTQTEDSGCVSLTFSGFTAPGMKQTITITEGTQGPEWTQTAPADGIYGAASVAGGVITVVVTAGDEVAAPNFGNMRDGDRIKPLVITASASTSFDRAFTFGIAKSVDATRVLAANGSATFNYAVTVTHDAGTDSRWQATGTVRISNPNTVDIAGVTLATSATNSGACTFSDATLTIPALSHVDVPYTCTYSLLPAAGVAQATASWSDAHVSAEATIDFATATMTVTDGQAVVTDSMAGSLGTVSYQSPNPTTFAYAVTFASQTAGTCTTHDNIAAFTTNSTETHGATSKSVQVCVGANLGVSTTATATFASAIRKDVNKTRIEQAGGTGTFSYTVNVTETGWTIAGTATIANPNDWQDVSIATLNVFPSAAGAACVINNGTALPIVGRLSSITVPYSCTFAAPPSVSNGLSTAAISWDAAAATTTSGSASATAAFAFQPLTVKDTFNGVTSVLGTVTAAMGGATYAYSQTVTNATAGLCKAYVNSAAISETAKSAEQTVNMCNTATGALTIGFWQNKNGQAIITGGAAVSNVCVAGAWLRTFKPFQDLAATSTCTQVATYATNVIKAANASGAAMNAMLKAQMLATAFDVFFSTPSLGGNKTGAPVALGGVMIDLAGYASGFGGAVKMSVLDMLTFASNQSNAGGATWYANVKTVQEFTKNAFDAINNAIANIAP